MTKRMSSISSSLNLAFISSEFGSANSHTPKGLFPIIGSQLPALPRRVLIVPSTEEAPPPTAPGEPSAVKRKDDTGTSKDLPSAREKYNSTCWICRSSMLGGKSAAKVVNRTVIGVAD